MPCFDLVQIGIVGGVALAIAAQSLWNLRQDRNRWRQHAQDVAERLRRANLELRELRGEVIS